MAAFQKWSSSVTHPPGPGAHALGGVRNGIPGEPGMPRLGLSGLSPSSSETNLPSLPWASCLLPPESWPSPLPQSHSPFSFMNEVYRRRWRHRFNSWLGKIPWRRKWQPTPVFSPGKSHGQRSLAGCSPRGHKESDTTEWLNDNKKNYSRMMLDAPTAPSLLVCVTKPPTSTPTSIYLVASQAALCPFKPLRTEVQPLLVGHLISD